MSVLALSDPVLRTHGLDVLNEDAPWAVLLFVFEGDALAWLRYLEQQGSVSQRRDDLPLARAIASWCDDNEALRCNLLALAERLRGQSH